jgi:signal transduction histidine kinase
LDEDVKSDPVYRILLVEDDIGEAELMAERFTDLPAYQFELLHVVRLQQAIEVLDQQPIDTVVLDLNLPDSVGLDTLRRLRAAHPEVVCVVFSGLYSDELHRDVLQLGGQDLLGKNDSAARMLTRSILYAAERHRAVTRQQQMLKLVVAANPDAVIVADVQGRVQFVNEAALELFDRRREDFVGELLGFSVKEEQTSEIEILRSGEQRIGEMRVVHVDWNGKQASLAVIRDTTVQHKLADRLRQAQKMEAIGRLAGGIAHDFNNILAAIAGNVELAREDLTTDHPAQESLSEIAKATRRATEIVRQILAFSRQREVEHRPLQPQLAIQEASRFLRATLPASVDIQTHVDAALPSIMADATQIHQIFMNLGANAALAMRAHGGRLEISASAVNLHSETSQLVPELQPGRYVCVSVSDTGHGIDRETLRNIFDPFFTTKTVGEGTGLGLSVVHGIVKNHNGNITVYSEPGKGTIFKLYFPAIAVPAEEAIKAPSPALHGANQTILYVDDEEPLLRLVTRMLGRRGYNVVGFHEPRLAIEAVKIEPTRFEAAIVDLSMPQLDGPEVVRQLQRIRPDLPIIMVTGFIRPEDIEVAHQLGVRDLLLKPTALDQLAECLHHLLVDVE